MVRVYLIGRRKSATKANARLNFTGPTRIALEMSSETKKALGLILIYTALLFSLIGWAGAHKSQFHFRAEIATAGYYTAGVFVALGVIMLLLSLRKRS